MKDIEYWKKKGFRFEARFSGEYDLWKQPQTGEYLRRYYDGREVVTDRATGKYQSAGEK